MGDPPAVPSTVLSSPMTHLPRLAFAAALTLTACSGSSGKGAASDAGAPATLYGICAVGAGASGASLGMSTEGVYGYTLPVPAGQTESVTLTVLNRGDLPATRMLDATPPTSALAYVGGSYPGTGGTCATELAPGETCTLVVTLVGPATGRRTSLVIIEYY